MNNSVPDVVGKLREQLAAIEQRAAKSETGGGHPPAAGDRARATARNRRDDQPLTGAVNDPTAIPADDRAAEERDEEQRAKAICLRLLADSARPRAGLQQKLLRRGISPEVIERVLDRFTEVGLIDDQAYAEAFVRTKHQERALSRHALAAELRRKGVDDGHVQTAVEQIDSGAEESRAAALMTKRVPAAMAAGPEVARRRLLGLLDRRGYPPDMSIRVVDDAIRRHLDETAG